MSERIESVIVVTDKGSQTFVKVADSATKMGNTIDQATTKASRGTDNLAKRQAALGAVFATFTGVLSTASQANAEAEASQARLNTAIEDSGHFVSEYQDQLDAASKKALQLGFDDEDAADAVAKLTTATGDANKAISDLAIAEDISRARKIDLASATQIVIAAEQGRVGALARIGIQVDKNSTAEERLDALRNQFAGNAEAYAATEAGARDRLTNKIENQFEALGHLLGPTQQYIALLPGLSAGYTAVGAAVGALAPEMEGATVAAGALDIALGPVGLVLAAGAAGLAVYELYKHLHSEATPGEEEARQAAEDLNETLRQQLEIGSKLAPLTRSVGDSLDYIGGASDTYTGQVKHLNDELADLKQNHQDETVIIGQTAEGYPIVESAIQAVTDQLAEYTAQQGQNQVSTQQLADARKQANLIMRDSGPAAELAQNTLQSLYAAEQAGTLYTKEGETQWQAYLRQIIELGTQLPGMNENMIKAGIAVEDAAKKTAQYNQTLAVSSGAFDQLNTQLRDYKNIQDEIAGQDADKKAEAYAKTAGDLESSFGAAIETQNAWLAGQYQAEDASAAGADSFLKQAQSLGVLDSTLEQLIGAGVSTWAERTANRVITATDALGSGINVIIDGTKSLSSQSQNLSDWAVDLINVAGSYGKIDDLLAHGQITLTTYNQAQDAGARIIADNAAVQEDLLRIQAKQAPILADLADKQAKYIDQLADLPPQQELVALGWMDQNEAAKANAALNLAAAAAAGEYGDAGEKAATAAITAQAQADPAFAAMLKDMGLISVGADGTITVNFPDSETIQEAVDNLTGAVEDMTAALLGVPPDVYTQITANDNATSVIDAVRADLNALNGTAVYTSVYTTYIASTPDAAPGYHPTMLGGIIPHAQTGVIPRDSRLTMVGEAGPELVRLPGGSMVYPAGASKEMAKRTGGGGDIHLHNATINLYPPDTNVYDALRAQLYSGGRG